MTLETIERAFKDAGLPARSDGAARWQFDVMNGRPLKVAASVDSEREWLTLAGRAAAADDSAALWRALTINGTLGGFAKFALRSGELHLCAELPLERRELVQHRLSDACDGFKQALEQWEGTPVDRVTPASSEPAQSSECQELALGCRESGWNVSERGDGSFAVAVGHGHRMHQALLQPHEGGAIRVKVEVVSAPQFSEVARGAIGLLLLRATAAVKLARASVDEQNGRVSVRFEVGFDTAPDLSDVNHALAALGAAVELASAETRSLQNETVAKRYLAINARET